MGLEVSFDACQGQDCDKFNFYETTKVISPSNVTGWGAPNPDTSDALTAVFSLQFPDTTTLLPTGTPVGFNLFTHSFPTVNDLSGFELSSEDFGMAAGTDFNDGIYYGTYTVGGTFNSIPFTSTDGNYFLFACQTRCCLQKAFVALRGCGCDDKNFCQVMLGLTLLDAAERAAICGDIQDAADMLNEAMQICDSDACKNC